MKEEDRIIKGASYHMIHSRFKKRNRVQERCDWRASIQDDTETGFRVVLIIREVKYEARKQ